MKILLILIFFIPQIVFSQECVTFRKERLKICEGMKVRSMHTMGHPWVEVKGIDLTNRDGKTLIIKTGRDFHPMNSDAGDDLCNGCEPAGLDDIRVGPDAYINSDEVVSPPSYSY